MTYVGGSTVYQFDEVSRHIGISSRSDYRSVIFVDGLYYWLNATGVYLSDGYIVKPIADRKLLESLVLDTLSHPDATSFPAAMFGALSVAHDSLRGLIVWRLGSPSNLLVYSIATDTFTLEASAAAGRVFSGTNATGTNRATIVYEVRTSEGNKLTQWLGTSARAVGLQTGFIELEPGARVQFQGSHLLGSQYAAPTIGIKAIDDLANADVLQTGFTSLTAPARDIKYTGRDTGRYLSFRVSGNQSVDALLSGLRVYYERSSEA
jgi:hypothetical protein